MGVQNTQDTVGKITHVRVTVDIWLIPHSGIWIFDNLNGRIGMLSSPIQTYLDVSKRVWGPVVWYMVHKASLKATISQFSELLGLLSQLLPCSMCRTNMENYTRLNPLKPEVSLFTWSADFHNTVNKDRQSTIFPLTHYQLWVSWDVVLEMENGPDLKDITEVVGSFIRLLDFRWKNCGREMTLIRQLVNVLKNIFQRELRDLSSDCIRQKTDLLAQMKKRPDSRYVTFYSRKI
jgi:hypothetical protein